MLALFTRLYGDKRSTKHKIDTTYCISTNSGSNTENPLRVFVCQKMTKCEQVETRLVTLMMQEYKVELTL